MLPEGCPIIIEGTFLRLEAADTSTSQGSPRLTLMVEVKGETVRLISDYSAAPGQSIPLHGGVIDLQGGTPPEPGEVIRIQATTAKYDKLYSKRWQPYLVVAGDRRMAAFRNDRSEVENQLVTLAQLAAGADYAAVRKLFSKVRQQRLTRSETLEGERIMMTLPEHERSVYADKPTARIIEEVYGFDPETLTAAAYRNHVRAVTEGRTTITCYDDKTTPLNRLVLLCTPERYDIKTRYAMYMEVIEYSLVQLAGSLRPEVRGSYEELATEAIRRRGDTDLPGSRFLDDTDLLVNRLVELGVSGNGLLEDLFDTIKHARFCMQRNVSDLRFDQVRAWAAAIKPVDAKERLLRSLRAFAYV